MFDEAAILQVIASYDQRVAQAVDIFRAMSVEHRHEIVDAAWELRVTKFGLFQALGDLAIIGLATVMLAHQSREKDDV